MLRWEVHEKCQLMLATLEAIFVAADSSGTKTGALLPEHFPGLFANSVWEEFKQGRYQGVDLLLPQGENGTYTLEEVPGLLIDEVYDWCKATHHFMTIRFVDCKGAPRQGESGGHQAIVMGAKEARSLILTMGTAFDLRRLCMESEPPPERVAALRVIHALATASGSDVPLLVELEEEYSELGRRLFAAAQGPFKRLWIDNKGSIASRTVIMKSLFTDSGLYTGLGGVLSVFDQCALKICNEAVVEGMGSIVNMHADRRRGLSAQKYASESFVHYNGPPLPKADGIIKAALDIHFGGKPWHFTQTSREGQRSAFSLEGQVMRRHSATPCKLAFMES